MAGEGAAVAGGGVGAEESYFTFAEAVFVAPRDTTQGQGAFVAVEVSHGSRYLELKKADRKLQNLLVPTSMQQGHRPLARTSIFETLTTLRDHVTATKCDSTVDALKRFGRNRDARRLKAKLEAIEGEPVILHAPSTGTVPGMVIKSLYRQPGKPVQVELTDEVLTYLRNVLGYQITEGATHNLSHRDKIPEDKRFHSEVAGVSKIYLSDKVRAVKRVKGRVMTKVYNAGSPSSIRKAHEFLDDDDEIAEQLPTQKGDSASFADGSDDGSESMHADEDL
jgi:hypothetical protein